MSSGQSFDSNPDNVEFVDLLAQLREFGQTQGDIAALLQISSGQLSRVKKGERHALPTQVKALRRKLVQMQGSRLPASSPFQIDRVVLERLTEHSAVSAFRDLLWAKAMQLKMPRTSIAISAAVFTADQGVDAAVSDHGYESALNDELLAPGTRFQIKTGKFSPWQPSQILKELFGRGRPIAANLGSEIHEALKGNKRFVLVCFGVDPTPDQLSRAKANLANAFEACGYPGAKIEIWGQTHLLGLFNQHLSLCLQLIGFDQGGFRSRESWAGDEDMRGQPHYGPEHQQLLEELRDQLRSGDIRHLRLLGPPGIGKTRFALELTGVEDLARTTIYVRDGSTLLKSSLLHELLQASDLRFATIVVDECPPKDRAEIWNALRPRSDRFRVITIDHGPDVSIDNQSRTIELSEAGEDEIAAILRDHGLETNEAKRWASFCQGCPRVAHVLGENLRDEHRSVLSCPTNVDIWDRFILGRDGLSVSEVALRKRILGFISLFERFGFESPVEHEARFIAQLAGVEWQDFRSVVMQLKQRRILQGAKTLYITPRLLHIYSYVNFWESHGSSFDITDALEKMQGQLSPLRYWFVNMFKYAHESRSAERALEQLLGRQGLFRENTFPESQEVGRLFNALAEAVPAPTLRCMCRLIEGMTDEQLIDFKEGRQSIVWALERIAAWGCHFEEASMLLLRLAETEEAKNSNNATGTLRVLFSLIPGMATTEADASQRVQVLSAILESDAPKRRRIGLLACESALSRMAGGRLVGPEHQGLRRTLQFWMPRTYGELWNGYRAVWNLLRSKLPIWAGDDRRVLVTTIVNAASSMIEVDALTTDVIETLKELAADPNTHRELTTLSQELLRYHGERLSDEIRGDLQLLLADLEGNTFPSKLRRFVANVTQEDYHDAEHRATGLVDEKQKELVREACSDPDLLWPHLEWLLCETSSPSYWFGIHLQNSWRGECLIEKLTQAHSQLGTRASESFLCGVLAAEFARNPNAWEAKILWLADQPSIAPKLPHVVINSGISNRVVTEIVDRCRQGRLGKEQLQQWWFSDRLRSLSHEVVDSLIEVQLDRPNGSVWNNAVHMAHSCFLTRDGVRRLPEMLVYRLLTHEAMTDSRAAQGVVYYWSQLATAFIAKYPNRSWDLFSSILQLTNRRWSVVSDLDFHAEQVMTKILESDPERALSCIARMFPTMTGEGRFGVQRWLAEVRGGIDDSVVGPILSIPTESLFEWVNQDVENRGPWLAGTLPKTLDGTPAGRLTRNVLATYGRYDRVLSSLRARFHSRSWSGSESDMYRRLREEARGWLIGERHPIVLRWIEEYIEDLGYDIERAEIDEERDL